MASAQMRKVEGLVLVMGETGSGKSHFINKLVESGYIVHSNGLDTLPRMKESGGVESCTKGAKMVLAQLNDESSLAVVDTPGFDDSGREDDEILHEIASYLSLQHESGLPLKGIVFLYPIIDIRYKGHSRRYFEIFQRLCGEEAFGNIALVTTMWDRVPRNEMGEARARFQQLRSRYWSEMEDRGAYIAEFHSKDPSMAQNIIYELHFKPPIVLRIQREICEQDLSLDQTTAGRLIAPELEKEVNEAERRYATLEQKLYKARQKHNWDAELTLEEDARKTGRDKAEKVRRRNNLGQRVKEATVAKMRQIKRDVKWTDALGWFMSAASITANIVVGLLSMQ